jgi:hypothetical protein
VRRHDRDRGEVTATVAMLPVVLVALLFVVQFGLTYYARQVLAGAAQDGAAAAARLDASVGEGEVLAESLIGEAGGALLESYDASVISDGDVVTVSATGEVVSLLPFFGSLTVEASASASIESFDGQGAP